MNVLFVLADGKKSTFYLFELNESQKMLTYFLPEFEINGMTVAEWYEETSLDGFVSLLKSEKNLDQLDYLVLKKTQLIDYLFTNSDAITVSNPSEFTFEDDATRVFKKGKQTLDRNDFEKFITYQQTGDLSIFRRQEHVLRLIKEEILDKGSMVTIPKRFASFKKIVDTDLGMKQAVNFLSLYQKAGKQSIKRCVYDGSDT